MSLASTCSYLEECRDELADGSPRTALEVLREALKRLSEDSPFAWSGASSGLGAKIKDFAKRKVTAAIGGGKARGMAQQAFAKGQTAMTHGQQAAKAASKAAKTHQQATKTHQAAMQHFKNVQDQANKEGDRDTANWAAQAGAHHTNQRAFHMQQASGISKWAKGSQSAGTAQHGTQTHGAERPNLAQKPAGVPDHSAQAAAMAKDSGSKVAASDAKHKAFQGQMAASNARKKATSNKMAGMRQRFMAPSKFNPNAG